MEIKQGTPISTAPSRYRVMYKVEGKQCFHGCDTKEKAFRQLATLAASQSDDLHLFECKTGKEFWP